MEAGITMNYQLIFENLCNSFKELFQKTGAVKAVIGISGGIDSALAAVIACRSIGADNVAGFFLPYKTSSLHSLNDSKILSEKYGFKLEILDITHTVDSITGITDNISLLRKGNIMSRCRMVYLFDKAAEYNGIVIGTTNRTELLLGYGTWYGDTASSINAVGNLYKREVYEVSKTVDMPESIMKKAPTADLWDGQTDEQELGLSYDVIDSVLYDIEHNNNNKKELIEKYGPLVIEKIINRIIKNSFKRHTPLICNGKIVNRKKIDENIFLKLEK